VKEWFTVGEISSLFDLNVQTLRYYDAIGLFSPAQKRGASGARRYQFDQIYRLAAIRFLKKLGYPLERIRKSLDSRSPAFSIAEMRSQSAELRRRCEEFSRIREGIDRKLRFIEEKTASLDLGEIRLRIFPMRRYIPLGVEDNLYRQDDFYFYPTVVFYQGRAKIFGAMLTDDYSDEGPGPKPREIPGGDYLVGYHRGPYETIEESFARIRTEAPGMGLHVGDETVNVNIIDQFVERDARNYVTEIQMIATRRP
jgi:DNA-binding transcriptional MerR regulator/effector-binding domain-containing protein